MPTGPPNIRVNFEHFQDKEILALFAFFWIQSPFQEQRLIHSNMRHTLLSRSKKTFCKKLSFSTEETLSSLIPPNFCLLKFRLVPAGYARKCELAGVCWCLFPDRNLKYSYPTWINVQCSLVECVGLINIGKVSRLCQTCISLSCNVRTSTGQPNALSYEPAKPRFSHTR